MKISFILATNNNDKIEDITKFLKNVFSYKNKNFEVVIIDNYFYDDNFLMSLNDFFALYPKQIQIISNYRALDIATSRNLAIPYAKGKFLCFLQPTDLINEHFFPFVEKVINNKNAIDCIEYTVLYKIKNNHNFESTIRIADNTILDLKEPENKNVFALISPLLSTKLFNKEVIIKNQLGFRKPLQFDTFFLYTFLAHANNIYAIDKTLLFGEVHNIIKNDNSFELLSQWVHILNYYNNEKLKKRLNSELEYAYVRYALYNFLQLIATTNNPTLIQKTYDYIKEHINRRYRKFRNNPYLTNEASKNDPFPKIVQDLSQYLKQYCHDNQIKDDLRSWE